MMRLFSIAALAVALPLAAESIADCQALRHHGQLAAARQCFARHTGDADPFVRAEAFWGAEQYKDASTQFEAAVKQNPKNAEVRVRWGRLFLDRFNKDEAAKLFEEALKVQKDNANAYLGLALVISQGYGPKAVEFAHKAIELNPKLVEARELLAYLALEDSDTATARSEADKALAISNEALDALAIRATMDWMDDKPGTEWSARIFKINPAYGQAYALAGHFFVINRRYEEGIKLYRKALELDPRLWEARAELGVNLMRLGHDGEARKNLEECYQNGYRNAATVNSLRLLDSYKNFKTYETGTTILRLHKKEADLLYPYFQAELNRAMATYEKKYQMKLKGPVQLEVYPDHEDFAVRTLGLPGLGALGVTFGTVVAMDSPSGRKPGAFHWASTLWHELSHVYVLTATNHRVPRWFTEGMAVHEETAISPDWGDRLDPEAISAIENKKLLPVANLDRGFIRPSYPSQVVVSYFEAGRICDYIEQKWGYAKLLEMMHGYAALKTTPEVIQSALGVTPEDFDKQFLAWLDGQTRNTVKHFAEWKTAARVVASDVREKKYDEAIREGQRIRDFYPDYVEANSVYEMLADAYTAKGDKAAAMQDLERYSTIGGRSPAVLKRLSALEDEAGEKRKAAATLERLNYIYPEDEELHRKLGDLWLAQNNLDGAIREYRAYIATKPFDQAVSRFQLAKALRQANHLEDAREQVLLVLEAAPGFKPAQQMLLELSK